MSNTLTATVHVHRLEPGRHFMRAILQRNVTPLASVELPLDECQEPRPDWGQYSPVVTLPAVERALRARGYMVPPLSSDCEYYFGIATK